MAQIYSNEVTEYVLTENFETLNIWTVSPPLRQLLERTGNLRHAECCFLNRKIYAVIHLHDMDLDDIQQLVNEVAHVWRVLGWNTGNVACAINLLIQKARSLSSQVPDHVKQETLVPPELCWAKQRMPCPPYLTQHLMNAHLHEATTSPGPCLHATDSMVELVKSLAWARKILQEERFANIMAQLQLSEKYSVDSAAAMAKALELADEVPLPEDDLSIPEDQRPLKILKNAKRALRNMFIWVCIGWAKGLDSIEAISYLFLPHKEQTRAQLVNGFHKIRNAVANQLTGVAIALPLPGSKQKRSKKDSNPDPLTDVHTDTMEVSLRSSSVEVESHSMA